MSFSSFKNKTGAKFFIGALFILGGISQAAAYDFVYYFDDPNTNNGNPGNFWETCHGNLSLDNSNYSIGGTITVNGLLKSTNIEWISSCEISLISSVSFLDAVVPMAQKSTQVSLLASDTLAYLGVNTVGAHSLGFTVFSPSTQGTGLFNLDFNVVAVTQPAVDIYFGALHEVKSFASSVSEKLASHFVLPVYAQNNTATSTDKTAVKTPTATVIVLADVNIVDVIATSTNGVFSGRFSVQGKLGQQNDVHYGVMVLDDKDTILDAKELGIISKINQGETNRYTLKYQLPTYISGDVKVLLVAETAQGLTLSTNQIFKGNISGEKSNFPCSYIAGTKTSKVSKTECLSAKDTSLTISYGKGSIFATSTVTEKINLKADKKVALSPNVAPGEYFATIITKSGDKRILPFTKEGVYGNISSIVVHTGDKSNVVKVAVFADVSTSTVAMVNLVGANNEECGKGEADVKGVAVEFSIETKCKTGTVAVALKDKQGAVLGLSSEPFSVLTFVKEGNKDRISMSTSTLTGLLALIALIAVLVFIRNRNEDDMSEVSSTSPTKK